MKLSATRISTFLQCKKRYFKTYIEKSKRLENPAFKLGTAVHEALEYAGHLWVKEGLETFDKEQSKDIIKFYNSKAIELGITDTVDYKEGLSIIKTKLKKFEPDGKIIGLETKFGFGEDTLKVCTANGTELIGAIDKLVEIDEDTLLVVDYKTLNTVPDDEKLSSDVQLSMYHFAVRKLFPKYSRILLALDMLRKDESVYTYRTEEDMEIFEHYLDEIGRQMENFDTEKVVGNLNPLCSWCDHRHSCEEYMESFTQELNNGLDIGKLSDEELHSEWDAIKSKLKAVEMRKKELGAHIMMRLSNEASIITDGTNMFTIVQSKRDKYCSETLADIIPINDLLSMMTINTTKLKAYIDKNPKIKAKIEEARSVGFNSPFISTRKYNK